MGPGQEAPAPALTSVCLAQGAQAAPHSSRQGGPSDASGKEPMLWLLCESALGLAQEPQPHTLGSLQLPFSPATFGGSLRVSPASTPQLSPPWPRCLCPWTPIISHSCRVSTGENHPDLLTSLSHGPKGPCLFAFLCICCYHKVLWVASPCSMSTMCPGWQLAWSGCSGGFEMRSSAHCSEVAADSSTPARQPRAVHPCPFCLFT